MQSFWDETKVAIISRSPLLSVFGPRSNTSASSRMGFAVSGLKAKALAIPGSSGGKAIWGMAPIVCEGVP
jgi:hypothetical protein